MAKKRKPNKSIFSRDFQRHLLACVCRVAEAAQQLHVFLDASYFNGARLRRAYRAARRVWTSTGAIPSRALFTEQTTDNQLARALWTEEIGDWRAVLDHAADFARRQATKNLIAKWAEKVHECTDEELAEMVEETKLAVATGRDMGLSEPQFFHQDMGKHILDYTHPAPGKELLPTGMPVLDKAMAGGVARGELTIIVGTAKAGKSHFLINIAQGAMMTLNAFRVAFFTLELNRQEFWARLHRRITLTPSKVQYKQVDRFTKALRQKARGYEGEMALFYYPRKTCTASMIRRHLDALIGTNFPPDLLVVDFGNVMKPERWVRERREREASCFNDLSQIGAEYDIGVWSAAQANRDAVRKITIGKGEIGESWEIPQIVDGMLTISQTPEEREQGKCRLFGAAGRRWPDNFTLDCTVDLSKSHFKPLDFAETESESGSDESDLDAAIEKRIAGKGKKKGKKK